MISPETKGAPLQPFWCRCRPLVLFGIKTYEARDYDDEPTRESLSAGNHHVVLMAGATKNPSGDRRTGGVQDCSISNCEGAGSQDLPAAAGRCDSRTASRIGRPDWRSLGVHWPGFGVHPAKKSFSKFATSSVRRDSALERTSASLVKSMVGNSRCMMSSRSNGHEIQRNYLVETTNGWALKGRAEILGGPATSQIAIPVKTVARSVGRRMVFGRGI